MVTTSVCKNIAKQFVYVTLLIFFKILFSKHSLRKILDSYPCYLHPENVTGKIFSIEVEGRWEQILVVLLGPLQIYLLKCHCYQCNIRRFVYLLHFNWIFNILRLYFIVLVKQFAWNSLFILVLNFWLVF